MANDTCSEHGLERCPLCRRRGAGGRRHLLLAAAVVGVGFTGILLHLLPGPSSKPAVASDAPDSPSGAAQNTTGRPEAPCNRPATLKWMVELTRAGEHQRVVAESEGFIARCGEFDQLRHRALHSLKALSRWDEAIAHATALMEKHPYDKDYPVWRAQIWEQKGDLARAAADFRLSLSNQPRMVQIPFNLSGLLEKLGKPCEAILPIEQFLHFHDQYRTSPKVMRRLQKLRQHPSCADRRAKGSEVLRFTPGGPSIRAQLRVNGKTVPAIIDTGASYIALTQKAADKLGVDASTGRKLRLGVVGGVHEGRLVMLDKVAVGRATAQRVEAVVVDRLGGDMEALVGLSFLSRFQVTMDAEEGVLRLKSATPAHAQATP